MLNDTRRRFAAKVEAAGGPAAVASALGCSCAFITMILHRKRTPGMKLARAIEALYGIPMQDWVDAPTVKTVRRVG